MIVFKLGNATSYKVKHGRNKQWLLDFIELFIYSPDRKKTQLFSLCYFNYVGGMDYPLNVWTPVPTMFWECKQEVVLHCRFLF